jgi:uncharacterized membrane protein YeaQ/YmgE (transglycosylase-associated protein family)
MTLLLLTLTTGLLFGVLAPVIVPPIQPMLAPERARATWIMSALLGMSGALLGGHLGQLLGWYNPGQAAAMKMSAFCAVPVLVAYHAFVRFRVSR